MVVVEMDGRNQLPERRKTLLQTFFLREFGKMRVADIEVEAQAGKSSLVYKCSQVIGTPHFARRVFHTDGDAAVPRVQDEVLQGTERGVAFSSLEHLILHARHGGVTICVENTPSEMGSPDYLRAFVDETRLTGLRFNFDIGHAHLAEFPEEERLEKSFSPL